MSDDPEFVVISGYPLERAMDDGLLIPVFEHRWSELSGGAPIVMTAAIAASFSLAAVAEIWNEYVVWRTHVMPTLPEEDRLFATTMNGATVWVIEDAVAFTVLFPDDY